MLLRVNLKNNNKKLLPTAVMPPAVLALFVQFFSFVFCLILFIFAGFDFLYSATVYFFIAIQAAVAAFFSFLLDMDWWWWPIQFLFPVLVVIFAFSGISPFYYLIAFLFFALLYWSTFRTQVPYYPSTSSLLPIILDMFPPEKSMNFIDIGSGLGGLLIELSRVKKNSFFYGIEIAPLPWFISVLRGRICKDKVQFTFGNYENINFHKYDIVFAYLSPVAMPDLWNKAKKEMRTGSILLSYEFIIPNVEPDLCVNLNSNDPVLYLWRI